jgi:cell division protein FtsB
MSTTTARQAVLEYFADDVLRLEAEVATYRDMLSIALAQNAELLKQHAALRQQIADRRDEIQRYVAVQMPA